MINKGKLVQCPVFGTFLPASIFIKLNNIIPEEGDAPINSSINKNNLAKLENTLVCWGPNVQFLENMSLFYKDDGVSNLNPYHHLVMLCISLIIYRFKARLVSFSQSESISLQLEKQQKLVNKQQLSS